MNQKLQKKACSPCTIQHGVTQQNKRGLPTQSYQPYNPQITKYAIKRHKNTLGKTAQQYYATRTNKARTTRTHY